MRLLLLHCFPLHTTQNIITHLHILSHPVMPRHAKPNFGHPTSCLFTWKFCSNDPSQQQQETTVAPDETETEVSTEIPDFKTGENPRARQKISNHIFTTKHTVHKLQRGKVAKTRPRKVVKRVRARGKANIFFIF